MNGWNRNLRILSFWVESWHF